MTLPDLIVLDVNETLSDQGPLGDRFVDLGADRGLAATWFAGVLRDGFALGVHGRSAPFADVGAALLPGLLPPQRDDAAAARHVLEGFTSLAVHDDVVPGLRALAELGVRLVTLSNGSTDVAEGLLARAGVRDLVEAVLSVEDAGVWKPARAAYDHALRRTGVPAPRAMLVAVHPWDLDGARVAGLRTAWIDRTSAPYPDHFVPAEIEAGSLTDLASSLRDDA